jgi:hypothetical protein
LTPTDNGSFPEQWKQSGMFAVLNKNFKIIERRCSPWSVLWSPEWLTVAAATSSCPGHDVKLPIKSLNRNNRNQKEFIHHESTKTRKPKNWKEKLMKTLLEKIKKNHALAMILCCAIPLVGILALSSLGVLGSWGYYALILICPLGHIFMMRGMHSSSKESGIQQSVKQIDDK